MTVKGVDAGLEKQVQDAIESTEIEKIYFNGFINFLGTGDILITLQRNGVPVTVLNTSYTVAKTLAIKLNQLITELEKKTGNTIMTTEDINATIQEIEKKVEK